MNINIKGIAYELVKGIAITFVVNSLLTDPTPIKSMEVNTPEQVKTHSKLKFSFDFVYNSESE